MNPNGLLQFAGVTIAMVSAAAAIVSVFLAWQAVEVAKRSSIAALLTELHKLYLSDPVSAAVLAVWRDYRRALASEGRDEREADKGALIGKAAATQAVKELIADPVRRQATHAAFWFWEHLAILVSEQLLDADLALTGFGSPAILGYLYPVDEAWVKEHGGSEAYRGYLKQLYKLWQRYAATRR